MIMNELHSPTHVEMGYFKTMWTDPGSTFTLLGIHRWVPCSSVNLDGSL